MPLPRRPLTVITGASRGIGAATAVHLARCGHDVVVGYREDQASAAAVVAAVEAAGGSALKVAGDVTDEDDMARLFEAAWERSQGWSTTPA